MYIPKELYFVLKKAHQKINRTSYFYIATVERFRLNEPKQRFSYHLTEKNVTTLCGSETGLTFEIAIAVFLS